jgi:DNA-directed RNA polymerase specialized sigma24 family protein
VSIERIDLRVDLERLAARLTTKQRVTLWLVVQGYTHQEIANAEGVGRTAITMRLQRAREAIGVGQT